MDTVPISFVITEVNNPYQTHNELENNKYNFMMFLCKRNVFKVVTKIFIPYRDVIVFSCIINLKIISPI